MEHGWRMVTELHKHPQHCAVFPHIGSSSRHKFLDTNTEIEPVPKGSRIYISDVAIQEMAKAVGMIPKSHLKNTAAELKGAHERIDELEQKVAELERFKAAVDLVKAEL